MILFLDYAAPKPYTDTQLAGCGGTEATVARIAKSLSTDHTVLVEQGRREVDEGMWVKDAQCKPDVCVSLRIPQIALSAKIKYPKAKHYLWLHDLADDNLAHHAQELMNKGIGFICVSNFHKQNVLERITRGQDLRGTIDIRVIYNPIPDGLSKDLTPVKANKLVFFSSPHKGLDLTLKVFANFKYHPEISDSKLYIANPGYLADSVTPDHQENVIKLGPLPHAEALQHVRESLCVFHLNAVFPETFGLVYAEANAVGTPFITAHLGATGEVSDHPSQLLDVRDTKKVIDRVIAWRSGARPRVMANPEFYLGNVRKKWLSII